jgi:hypothetical protein
VRVKLLKLINNLMEHIKNLLKGFERLSRDKATEALQYELEEMEFAFVQMLFSSFVGLPAVPESVALEVLPHMGEELARLEGRAAGSEDLLAELFGKLNFE